jgi:hypothetical protein
MELDEMRREALRLAVSHASDFAKVDLIVEDARVFLNFLRDDPAVLQPVNTLHRGPESLCESGSFEVAPQ